MARPARSRKPNTQVASLDELRALAHPLRLRAFELFAECPRTSKQVAEALGIPPTRLYHHVHALERAGLVRLRETRQKRGVHEKYYEVPLVAGSSTLSAPRTGDRAARRQRAALAMTALELTRREVASALGGPPAATDEEAPLVLRAQLPSRQIATKARREIVALLRSLGHDAEAQAARSGADSEAWALTVTLAPAGKAAETPRVRTRSTKA